MHDPGLHRRQERCRGTIGVVFVRGSDRSGQSDHYYVNWHGWYYEVTKNVWLYSYWHATLRCPANRLYEWRKEGKRKFPMRNVRKDRQLFTFAGLWDK